MASEEAPVPGEDFVTIVPVGEGRAAPPPTDPSFVTVLTVGAAAGAAEVLVQRPRGARLGLGLKFEGGSAAAEKVRRLLVQSCAEDSPAASACTPWGKLIPGDEILAIDSVPVFELTRIDCVRRLKDSDETLKLLVRHFESEKETQQSVDTTDGTSSVIKQAKELSRPTCLPPPVPPRKLNKKNSFKDKLLVQNNDKKETTNGHHPDKDLPGSGAVSTLTLANKLSRKSSFDSHIHRQSKEGILRKSSPEEVRRLVRRLSDGKSMPPEAEVYIDLLSQEWERCLALADAESDDTGSSISTVVDRLGSMTSSVENSIPSTPTMQPKTIDIQRVLNCIENIDSNLLKDISNKNFVEKVADSGIQNKKNTEKNEISLSQNRKLVESVNNVVTTEESIANHQLNTSSDKNNNNTNTIVKNVTCINIAASEQTLDKTKPTDEIASSKPKPMPRSVKPERDLKELKNAINGFSIKLSENVPTEQGLLTPTKKNCIENWLETSEAELASKDKQDHFDETSVPEALPRLIDFVPKPNFKETEVCSEAQQPTGPALELRFEVTAPAETREDGSGASLDTIGELDETIESAELPKAPSAADECNKKIPFENCFWDERQTKSDADDNKSLSNDESLPSCPRQPPDGVEAPTEPVEKVPELRTRPTCLPPRVSAPWPSSGLPASRPRTSFLRSQDARSECSVKDKIAMFSSDVITSTDNLDKVSSKTMTRITRIPGSQCTNHDITKSLDRRLTRSQDNLDGVLGSPLKRLDERPAVLGAQETMKNSVTRPSMTLGRQNSSKYIHYGSTSNLNTIAPKASPIYSSTQNIRRTSDAQDKGSHKSTLEYLIEQRKKSMSKLRGLMIPEVQGPIVDLPEIKIQESTTNLYLANKNNSNKESNNKKTNTRKTLNLNETWKTHLISPSIPKYSPAFKRKSLQVYSTQQSISKESTPEPRLDSRNTIVGPIYNRSIPLKPPRTSIDTKKTTSQNLTSSTLPPRLSLSSTTRITERQGKGKFEDIRDYRNVEVKICTATDVVDSDNDSAMSSTQSSYRSSASSPLHNMDSIESDCSHLSPRSSQYIAYSLMKTETNPPGSNATLKQCVEYEKKSVYRSVSSDTNISVSSSTGSGATSGSQASCSSLESSVADTDKKKVSRTHCIDTLNRRNILASAKCRSGRDANLTSPVLENKFSHDSSDRSPSPRRKVSERLSSLTATVSAMSNKGDSRRFRNKILDDSETDSDCELNVRHRKSDHKSRLKKNQPIQVETQSIRKDGDGINIEKISADAPQVISERIIKEIKKAGMNDFKITRENNTGVKSKSHEEKPAISIRQVTTTKSPENRLEEIIKSKTTITQITTKSKSRENPIQDNKVKISDEVKTKEPKVRVVKDQLDAHVNDSYKVFLNKGEGAGVGLILAGGIDCEAKEVTVHRVLAESAADRAGLKRGARVLSINGCLMSGLTHAETVAVLKDPRSEVVIEIEKECQENDGSAKNGSDNTESKECVSEAESTASGLVSVVLEKAGGGAGLGFGLDGGKDSPRGDRPLTIKKLFAGGAAARSGRVLVGAQLVSAGGVEMTGLSRTQAWAALKALPSGPVTLVLRSPC